MPEYIKIAVLVLTAGLLLASCNSDKDTALRGTVENGTDITMQLEFAPLHYKYADRKVVPVKTDERGRFQISLTDLNEPEVAFLTIGSTQYPVYLIPGTQQTLLLNYNTFPRDVQIHGHSRAINERYQNYLSRVDELNDYLRTERRKFNQGEPNDYFDALKLQTHLSKEYLGDTPLNYISMQHVGNYLLSRLDYVINNKPNPGFYADYERNRILRAAAQYEFFGYSSLKAQRAGIRDFADKWIRTYDIREVVEAEHGQRLTDPVWKYLAHEEIYAVKKELLDQTTCKRAHAHAEMYLTAELLGEAPFEFAGRQLDRFNEEYYDYTEYREFLNTLSDEITKIQPGNPAPDFNFADANGTRKTLRDFDGNYVLLEFWASWCGNCMYQKSYKQDIYSKFSSSGFEIVTVSIDEDREAWENAVSRSNYPWINLYAGDGFENELFNTYRAGSIPFYVLIDRNGEILRVNNIRPSFNLETVVEDLLFDEHEMTYALR